MARGQRKTLEEKISAKQELIEALTTRIESEKRELNELYEEFILSSRRSLARERALETSEVAEVLQQYIESRTAQAS